ncbi:hypothetical protein [Pseudoalteromonas luteoviolacea]|uniref:hypothetical protein n=1 Tax=Pseudoalteromonas luteoviolacea TaxID=43657 RepID=UPI001B379557|nr:hypothetical protein [Pseudoalteromonas luteoviolacea]MBQ4839814.1 hypothetical protein [Pseudoalteromonas luteoviolacea]
MNEIKQSLISKLSDYNGSTYDLETLYERLEIEIALDGPNAKLRCQLKGNIGKNIINKRRVFVGGPQAIITDAYDGKMFVEINPKELLFSLFEHELWQSAMIRYVFSQVASQPMTIERYTELLLNIVDVSVSSDLLEQLLQQNSYPRDLGRIGYTILGWDILAAQKSWKSVDINKCGKELTITSKYNHL